MQSVVCLLVAFVTGFAALTSVAWAETEIDLALVIAVDVSRSMDEDEQTLQRDGFVAAFRSSVVHDAIRNGSLGGIAVAYLEWSGPTEQRIVVPWVKVAGADDAIAFSDRLKAAPIGRVFSTSISGAIDFGVRLLDESGFVALRKVIDVSGDGPNNTGRMVTLARDDAVAKGITINGLPFMLKKPSEFGDIENLDVYYRDCVIGGAGAFMEPVRERSHIADAIRTKIVREIADLGEQEIALRKANEPDRANCLVGRDAKATMESVAR